MNHTLVWWAALLLASTSSSALARNYLVVITDDLGVDKVSAYVGDYPTYQGAYVPETSAIDSLADAGVRFSQAWGEPLCSPTRAALQTGQHPFRSGVGAAFAAGVAGVDPTAFPMLANELAPQGFATGYFGKWHLGTEDEAGATGFPVASPFWDVPHPARSGWSHFYGAYDGAIGDYTFWDSVTWDAIAAEGTTLAETVNATWQTTDAATAWIADQSDPWVAVVAYHAPHSAQVGDDFFYGDADPTCYRTAALSCLATESCADEARSVYQALTECMDLDLEALLSGIDDATLDDTLVVFVGDNGTPRTVAEDDFLFDWNGDGLPDKNRGKGTTYETGIRIPLVVADGATWRTGAPGVIDTPGRVATIPVEMVDLYETLYFDAMGLSSGSSDGDDFTDCFSETSATCGRVGNEFAYAEKFVDGANAVTTASIGVRWGGDKLVGVYSPAKGCLTPTYYDLATDPFERFPAKFKGTRANRLKDHFTNLHTGTASWGDGVTFCK